MTSSFNIDLEKMKEEQQKIKKIRQEFSNDMNAPIYKICLTGGPCGGKTTALTLIQNRLKLKGYDVYIVPEAATLSMMSGVILNIPKDQKDQILKTQLDIVNLQMSLEDFFVTIAKSTKKPSLILCDRGIMDNVAYMSSEIKQKFFKSLNFNPLELRDQRYNGVIHMVTAADGAAKYYSNQSNETRYESAKQAIQIDQLLQSAWHGHPHHYIISNMEMTSFEEKLTQVLESVEAIIGEPVTFNSLQKFTLESFQLPPDLNYERFKVKDIFLHGSNIEEVLSIRQTEQNGQYNFLQEKTIISREENWESMEDDHLNISRIKRPITQKEYQFLSSFKDSRYQEVNYEKISFLWEKRIFRIYVYDRLNKERGTPILLRVGQTFKNNDIQMPEFLRIKKDVTNDQLYEMLNWAIAHDQPDQRPKEEQFDYTQRAPDIDK